MKRTLMLVGAMVCAIGLQAASIDWAITANTWYLADGTSKAAQGTTVYLIDGGQWDSIKSAIDGGAKAFTTSDAGILAVASTSNAKGAVSGGTVSHGSLVAGTKYDFAYLVFDGDQYFASAAYNAAAYDTAIPEYSEVSKITFAGAQYSGATLSSGWASAAPIPEPTSGLLLLVGASLLALRRKQK